MGRTRLKLDADLEGTTTQFLSTQIALVGGSIPPTTEEIYEFTRPFQLARNAGCVWPLVKTPKVHKVAPVVIPGPIPVKALDELAPPCLTDIN